MYVYSEYMTASTNMGTLKRYVITSIALRLDVKYASLTAQMAVPLDGEAGFSVIDNKAAVR